MQYEEKQMVEHLMKDTFKENVFDFESKEEWEFSGSLPCVVDFYADWCGPSKMIAPTLESLSEDYEGKLKIYKVNTDQEQDIAMAFGVSSIPSILFVPKEGKPQMAVGDKAKCTGCGICTNYCPHGAIKMIRF
jgi:thioredoxin 1